MKWKTKTLEKNNETKSRFFGEISKLDKPPAMLKKEEDEN